MPEGVELRDKLFTALKVFISLGLIVFLFSRVNLAEVWRLISTADLTLLLLALALYVVAISVGCVKWQVLLRAQGLAVPFPSLLAYTFVGLFFGNALPSNVGGDVVRAYDLARHTGQAEASAISVLVDRLVGLAAFFAAAVVMAILTVAMIGGSMEMEQVIVAVVVAFGALLLAFALLFSRRLTQRGAFIFDWPILTMFKPTAQRVFQALQAYRHSYGALAQGLAISLAVVLITSLVQYAIAAALHLDIPLVYFLLFNPLIAFVLVVPISVNGIGLKEVAFVFFFGLVGVERGAALSISLLFHLIIVLSSLPGGLLWLRRRSLAPESGNQASS